MCGDAPAWLGPAVRSGEVRRGAGGVVGRWGPFPGADWLPALLDYAGYRCRYWFRTGCHHRDELGRAGRNPFRLLDEDGAVRVMVRADNMNCAVRVIGPLMMMRGHTGGERADQRDQKRCRHGTELS